MMVHNRIVFDAHQKQQIIDWYFAGKPQQFIADNMNVSRPTLRSNLLKWGIKLRTPIRYTVNHHAFDKLTNETLYWLGIMATDGCIHRERNRTPLIQLCLQDKEHIKKFKMFLQATYPIRPHGQRPNNYLIVPRSKPIADRLEQYGITQRKTHSLEISNNYPQILRSKSFWRGVIDGDGHIGRYTQHQKYKYALVHLGSTSHNFIQQYQQFIHAILGQSYNIRQQTNRRMSRKPLSLITISGKMAKKLLYHLYYDADIYLDRKYKRAIEIINA